MAEDNNNNKPTEDNQKKLTAKIAKQAKEIIALKDQLAAVTPSENAEDKPTYKDYLFLVDTFRFQGKKHSSKEAVKNEDLMKSLIKANFSGLKKTK